MTLRLDPKDYKELGRQAARLGAKPATLARMLVLRGLLGSQTEALKPRSPGSAKDEILWIAPDFDELPEEFDQHTV